MNRLLNRLCFWSGTLIAAVISSVMVLSLAFVGWLYVAHKQGNLHYWVERAFGAKLQYKVVQFQWGSLNPTLKLQDIVINNPDTKAPIRLRAMTVRFDVLSSLIHLSPIADSIGASGLHVDVNQNNQGQLSLVGLSANTSKGGHNEMHWQRLVPWLALQHNVHLANTTVVIHHLDKKPLQISGLDILWQRVGGSHYRLVISSSVKVNSSGTLLLLGDVHGNIGKHNGFKAKLYLHLQADNFADLLQQHSAANMAIKHGGGDVAVWLNYDDGVINRVHAVMHLQHVIVRNSALKIGLGLRHFNENILWKRKDKGWQLLMQHIGEYNTKNQLDNHIAINVQSREHGVTNWQVALSRVDVHLLSELYQVIPKAPASLVKALHAMSPQGTIDGLQMSVGMQGDHIISYSGSGKIRDLSESGWQKIPPLSTLSGHFSFNQARGTLALSSKALSMGQSYWFPRGWPNTKAQVVLAWEHQKHNWYIDVQKLVLGNPWLQINTQGVVTINGDALKQSRINLMTQFNFTHIEHIIPYIVPAHIISHALSKWFYDAFVSQPYIEGRMVWRGTLSGFPYVKQQGVFLLHIIAPHTDLRPYIGWPVVKNTNVDVWVDGPALKGAALNGSSEGLKLQQAKVLINDVWHASPLIADFDVHGDAGAAQRFLSQSPLKKKFHAITNVLKLSGNVDAALQLNQPLSLGANQQTSVSGKLAFKQLSVGLIPSHLKITQANGVIQLRDNLLFASGIHAAFLGHPLNIKITQVGRTQQQLLTAQGVLDSAQLNYVLPGRFKFVSGQSPFNFQLLWGDGQVGGTMRSQLKGLALNLPAPFHKSSTSISPSFVQVNLNNLEAINYQFHVGNLFAGQVVLGSNYQLKRGVVKLGVSDVPVLQSSGSTLAVNGIIPFLSIDQWQDVLHQYARSPQQKTLVIPALLSRISLNLHVGIMQWARRQFDQVAINAVQAGQRWRIGIDSSAILGNILLPSASQPQLTAKLAYFDLPEPQPSQKPLAPLTAKVLARLPPLDISIGSLVARGVQFGKLQWLSQPLPDGVKIQTLQLRSKNGVNADLSGSVTQYNKTSDKTSLHGSVSSQNWGGTLAAVGYPALMQQGQGKIDVSLHWLGHVFVPKLATLAGQATFDLSNGALSGINPGLAKVLGLFSIASLVKRLSLNFSDITENGLAFDTLKGAYVVSNSIAHTKKVSLSGPSLDLLMRGNINLQDKTLDQQVIVIPHVGGGIALAAGLLGGPIVGVATWVADKLLTSTVLKDRGLLFHITGSWDDPIVKSM